VSAERWLALGGLAGLALAAGALLHPGERGAPAEGGGVVAWVGGRPISRDTFARYVGAAARERGRIELDRETRRALLERLIDEELLLQQGLALDLERREPTARRAIVSAVIEGITSDEDPAEETRDKLAAFYAAHAAEFARPGPVAIEAALVPVAAGEEAAAHARAVEIAQRARAGEPLAELAAALGRAPDPPLPAEPLSLEALGARFGDVVAESVGRLAPGAVGDPVRAAEGWWVVRLVSRGADATPPLDDVLEPVRSAYRMKLHDERLERRLAELRARAEVRIADPDLAGP
jgi:hypothetical protein